MIFVFIGSLILLIIGAVVTFLMGGLAVVLSLVGIGISSTQMGYELKTQEDAQQIVYEVILKPGVDAEVSIANGQITVHQSKKDAEGSFKSSVSSSKSVDIPENVDVAHAKISRGKDKIIINFPKLSPGEK
jgi:hypothetical protein